MIKTDKNKEIRNLNLEEIEFDASGEYQAADINSGVAGDLLPFFEPYSIDLNHGILKLSAPVVGLPEEVIEELVSAVDYLYRERRMI